LIRAFVDGATIQYNKQGVWVDDSIPFSALFAEDEYRIKPKPREWWATVYENGKIELFTDMLSAMNYATSNPHTIVHLREVMD